MQWPPVAKRLRTVIASPREGFLLVVFLAVICLQAEGAFLCVLVSYQGAGDGKGFLLGIPALGALGALTGKPLFMTWPVLSIITLLYFLAMLCTRRLTYDNPLKSTAMWWFIFSAVFTVMTFYIESQTAPLHMIITSNSAAMVWRLVCGVINLLCMVMILLPVPLHHLLYSQPTKKPCIPAGL